MLSMFTRSELASVYFESEDTLLKVALRVFFFLNGRASKHTSPVFYSDRNFD